LVWFAAVGAALKARGVTDELKAKLRAEIFKVLDGDDAVTAPKPTEENLVINELIKEYLEYNGLRNTLAVFLPESGQPKDEAIPRHLLAHDLMIRDPPFSETQGQKVPLLYSLVCSRQKEAQETRFQSS